MPENENSPKPKSTISALKESLFLLQVPSYGNKIFYSLGFLALTCLTILIASGIIMVFVGPNWWLTSFWGIFFRSVHLWAAQAFIVIIALHALVVFTTSGFKPPRRLTWILGSIAAVVALAEAEFGYNLRGDFSSQYRALQGADFWNGASIGKSINTLNFSQIYGIHIIDIPIAILAILFFHYLLVKIRGIAKPYRQDVKYEVVPANHKKLFLRGIILAAIIIILAYIFPSPLIEPTNIGEIANENPQLIAQTLMQEFSGTSGTATYLDSIDPYKYDTREVYVSAPYEKLAAASGIRNDIAAFSAETYAAQTVNINQAENYFQNGGALTAEPNENPLLPAISSLVSMAKSGLYEQSLDGENQNIRPTYSLRFLADTGVLNDEASQLHITTEQWGMMREEKGILPLGAWWLAPIGIMNHTILANDANGDRDGAEILGLLVLLFILFPYIPYLNRFPEKLHINEFIWKK